MKLIWKKKAIKLERKTKIIKKNKCNENGISEKINKSNKYLYKAYDKRHKMPISELEKEYQYRSYRYLKNKDILWTNLDNLDGSVDSMRDTNCKISLMKVNSFNNSTEEIEFVA